jgi:SAM-dependent methyltransferase
VSKSFDTIYAGAYDELYYDKDYAAECDLIERIFQTYGNGTVKSVLDLGCGTGNHAIPLAHRGYEIVGVDRSESMIARAHKKLAQSLNKSAATFHLGDIRTIDLHQQFDAVLMMFAVLGYQLEDEDILSSLQAAHRHLRPGGVFIFDVWFGPAVLKQGPSQRVKEIPTPEGKIVRVTSGELDIGRHICTVKYHLSRLERERLADETEETHQVRYFFPQELEHFLQGTGFTLGRLAAFPGFDREPSEDTWNVLGVVKAISGG